MFRVPCCLIGLSLASPGAAVGADSQDYASQEVLASSPDGQLVDARAFLAEGKVEAAEANVRGYLTKHQNSGDAHFLLGLILFRKIQSQATEQLSFPDSRSSARHAASAQSRVEYARASLAEYTEGAKYERPSASDLKIVALDYVLLGSYADASKWLTRSLEENPKDAEAWYYLGRSKYNENRFEEAILAFERCLELEPRSVKAQSNLGLSYSGLNRIAEALAALQQAIAWQADSPRKSAEPYIEMGDLLTQQNRATEAVGYLLQAVEIAPGESRAREKLGNAYLNANDLSAAQSQLESGIAVDPDNPSLHYLLGTVYRKQGRPDKAKAELEKFQALQEAKGTERP